MGCIIKNSRYRALENVYGETLTKAFITQRSKDAGLVDDFIYPTLSDISNWLPDIMTQRETFVDRAIELDPDITKEALQNLLKRVVNDRTGTLQVTTGRNRIASPKERYASEKFIHGPNLALMQRLEAKYPQHFSLTTLDSGRTNVQIFGKEVSHDLAVSPIPVSDEITQSLSTLKDKYVTPGLSYGEHNTMVDYLAYAVNADVVTAYNEGKKSTSLKSILDSKKEFFTDTLAYYKEVQSSLEGEPTLTAEEMAELDAAEEAIPDIQRIIDGWKDLSAHTTKALHSMNTVTIKGDITLTELASAGSNLKRDNFEDDASIRVDGKKTVSKNLKRFLSTIADVEATRVGEDVIFSPKEGWLGVPLMVEYDNAYDTISGLLKGSKPDLESMLNTLESSVEAQPWLREVIDLLKDADSTVQNEFASSMAKHEVEMQAIVWEADEAGNYSLTVSPTNSNAIGKYIQDNWKNNAQNNMFEVNQNDTNEYIIDPDIANEMLERFELLDTADHAETRQWLADAGIDLSDGAWTYLVDHGITANGKYYTYNNLMAKNRDYSLIGSMNKAIKTLSITGANLANNNHYAANSHIKNLAVLEAQFTPTFFSNSFKNGENKTVYSYAPNKYLMNRTRELKTNENLRDALGKIPFSSTSTWLAAMSTKRSNLRDTFKTFYIDTLKKEGKKGVSAIKMSEKEQLLTRIGLFQNKGLGSDVQRTAKYVYPTTSDKKLIYGVTGLAITPEVEVDGVLKESTIEQLYDAIALPEIKRILHWQQNKGKYGVSGFEKGGGQFFLIPELNTIPGLYNDDGSLKNITSTTEESTDLRQLVKDKVREYVESEISLEKDTWLATGVNKMMDTTYMKRFGKNSVDFAVTDFVVNTMIANANMTQLFIGDPACFYKSKATPVTDNAYSRTEADTAAYVKAASDTYENIGKRLAGDVAPGTELANTKDNKYRQAFLEDRESVSLSMNYLTNLLDGVNFDEAAYYANPKVESLKYPNSAPYLNIEGTDAQELTTVPEHLFVMNGLGKISTEQYNELKTRYEKDPDNFTLSKNELGTVMQPVKPVYVDNRIVSIPGQGPSLDSRMYIKSSSFPLLPQFTKGTKMDALRQAMDKSGVSRAAYGTATKVGGPVTKPVLDEKGEPMFKDGIALTEGTPVDPWSSYTTDDMTVDSDALFKSSLLLDRKGFRIQQEVPFKEDKARITDGTQQRKLLFSNILSVPGFKYKGEKMNGTDLKAIYEDTYKKIFQEKLSALETRLLNDGKVDMVKLQDILMGEAKTQGFSDNDIAALTLNKEKTAFEIPIWTSPVAEKYEALLTSLVDTAVRDLDTRGNSFVLGSEDGFTGIKNWEELSEADKNKITWVKGHRPEEGLRAQRGAQAGEVLVPNKFRDRNGKLIDVTKMLDADGNLDTEKFPEELLEMFAYRIPTQGLNSMARIKVAGFLPVEMGDLLIAPRDWTIQMGSDFDVDKIFVQMYNLSSVNNKVSKQGSGFEGLENDLLDIHLSVMKNPSPRIQKQVMSPLGFGWLKEGTTPGIEGERLNLAAYFGEIFKDKNKFNPLSSRYQTKKYMNATAGKSGVGVFSLDSTLNASMQGKDIRITGMNKVKFGSEISQGDLTNELTLRSQKLAKTNKDHVAIRYKSDVIAAYQSAAVDNEKEQVLDKLNINNHTFATIRALNQMGFEEDIVSAFINQPVVRSYVNHLTRLSDSTGDFNPNAEADAKDAALNELGVNTTVERSIDHKLADLGFDDMVAQVHAPAKDVQEAMLEKFLKMDDIGKQLQSIQQAINTDSSGISPNMFEAYAKEDRIVRMQKKASVNTPVIVGAESLIGEYSNSPTQGSVKRTFNSATQPVNVYIKPTTINGFASVYGLFTSNDYWKELFPYNPDNAVIDDMFKGISEIQDLGDTDLIREAENKKKVWKEFKKYLYSTGFTEDVTGERARIMYDTPGSTSLATEMQKLKAMPEFANNAFLQRLQFRINRGNKPSLITYNASAAQNEKENRIYGGFVDLATSEEVVDGVPVKELANDMVKYAYLNGGIQEATQFVRYIPTPYLIEGSFAEKVNALKFTDDSIFGQMEGHTAYDVNAFTKQYFQHNPWHATSVDDHQALPSDGDTLSFGEKVESQLLKFNEKLGVQVMPTFISKADPKAAKGVALYQAMSEKIDGEVKTVYVKLDTLTNEYNTKELNAATLVGSNKGVIEAKRAALKTKSRQDIITVPDNKAQNPVDENKLQTPFAKYGLSGVTKGDSDTTKRVLNNIATLSTDPMHQNLAKMYSQLDIDVSIQEDPTLINSEGNPVLGRASYADKLISINPDHATNKTDKGFEHTFLHELTHQITVAAVEKGGPAVESLRNLTDILKTRYDNGELEISDDVADKLEYIFYGMVNGVQAYKVNTRHILQEFTAFAMSNTEFQGMLKEQPYVIKGQNFWEKLVQAWSNLIEAAGVTDPANMLSSAMNDVLSLTDQGRVSPTTETIAETKKKSGDLAISDQDIVSLNTLANMGIIKTSPTNMQEALTSKKNC